MDERIGSREARQYVPIHYIYIARYGQSHTKEVVRRGLPMWSHSAPPLIILLHSAVSWPKSEASTDGAIIGRGIVYEWDGEEIRTPHTRPWRVSNYDTCLFRTALIGSDLTTDYSQFPYDMMVDMALLRPLQC